MESSSGGGHGDLRVEAAKDHEVLLLPLKMWTDQLLKPTTRKLLKKDNPRRQRNRNRVAAIGPRRWQVQGPPRH